MKERIKIATALGYYARAVGEIKTLKDAIDAYALTEYRNDVDCQVAFRKGFQEAEKHFAAEGREAHELRELVGWIARLEQAVAEQRRDILEYLKRQDLIASTPIYMRAAAAPCSITEAQIDQATAWDLDCIAQELGAPPRQVEIVDKLFRQSILDFIAAKPTRAEPGGYGAGAVGYIGDSSYAHGGGGGGGSGDLHGSGASVAHIEAAWHRGDGSGGGGGDGCDQGMIAVDFAGTMIEIGGTPAEGAAPHYYLRRKDTGQLHYQNGRPVAYPTIPAAHQAIAELYISTGIACVPDLHRRSDSSESILDKPFQMRRVDNGELFCQDGLPVVHQGYRACMEACRYLYDNMGIHCEPSAGRPLGREWNPPVLEIKPSPELHYSVERDIDRWYDRVSDDLRKQHEE